MPKVPNYQNAIIPEAKITGYLLNLESIKGKDKARFFMAFGFIIEQWDVMALALKQHVATHNIIGERETPYGKHYSVEGNIQTPDKRNPYIRSVWRLASPQDIPILITAYPVDERNKG